MDEIKGFYTGYKDVKMTGYWRIEGVLYEYISRMDV